MYNIEMNELVSSLTKMFIIFSINNNGTLLSQKNILIFFTIDNLVMNSNFS